MKWQFAAAILIALSLPASADEWLWPSNDCLVIRTRQQDSKAKDLMQRAQSAGSPQEQQRLMLQTASMMKKFAAEVDAGKYNIVRPTHEYGPISENDPRCAPLN